MKKQTRRTIVETRDCPNVAALQQSLADELNEGRIVDESAKTMREIGVKTPYSYAYARQLVRERVDSGEWEMVWKHVNGKLTPAYRRTKKP